MQRYAQIDEAGRVVAISELCDEVEADHLIALQDEDTVNLHDEWREGQWHPGAPIAQVEEVDPIQRMNELEAKLEQALVLIQQLSKGG